MPDQVAGQARSYNPPRSEMSPTLTEQRSFSLDDRLLTPEPKMDPKHESGLKQVQEFEDFNNRFASMLARQSPGCTPNQQMSYNTPMNYPQQAYQPSVADYNSGPKDIQHFGYQRDVPYLAGPVPYYEPSRSLTLSDYNRRGTSHDARSTAVSWSPGLQGSTPQHQKSPGSSPLQATSRTQLKQQLMRQQLHQEEEKARQNFAQSYHASPSQNLPLRSEMPQYPMQNPHSPGGSGLNKSPINIPGNYNTALSLADMKAKSKLENPTEYHVVESQKRKIRSKCFNDMEPSSGEGTLGTPRSCVSLTGGSSTYEGSAPPDHQWGASDPTQSSTNKIFRSLPEIEIKTSENDGSCRSYINKSLTGCSDASVPGSLKQPKERPSYVALGSSVPDSNRVLSGPQSSNSENSEVHLIEDPEKVQSDKGKEDDPHNILKEFMKFDDKIKLSNSPQSRSIQHDQQFMQDSPNSFGSQRTGTNTPLIPQIKTEPQQHIQIDAYLKERKKKDSHNQIERSRRYNINARIEELCELLPKNNDPYYSSVFMRRQYKGHILKATVDYIKLLKHSHANYLHEEHRRKTLEVENRALVERLHELETRMRERGMDIQPSQMDKRVLHPNLLSSDVISSTTMTQHTSYSNPTLNHSANTTETACQPLFSQGSFPFGTDDSMLENVLSPPQETLTPITDSCNTQETQKEILDQIDFDVMDDESAFVSDPLFSSPQVSSPNSSRQSLDDPLNSDIMDVPS